MFKSLFSNFFGQNALRGMARIDLPSDDLMAEVATYLTELISASDRKHLYIDKDHIFFEGRKVMICLYVVHSGQRMSRWRVTMQTLTY